MEIEVLSKEKILSNLLKKRFSKTKQSPYFSFYSSWSGGLTFDAELMILPIDDHLVHRGDGVFEAIKAINYKPYLLTEHLARLQRSADFVGIKLPMSLMEINDLVIGCIQKSKLVLPESFLIRLFVSRGPGDFSTNPYTTLGAQIYLALTPLGQYSYEDRAKGVQIGLSKVPAKESWLAPYKTCNYLQNVLVKKESIENNWDFSICVSENGFITESSTENLCWINQQNEVCHPCKESILTGTIMSRAFDLAEKKLGLTICSGVELKFEDLPLQKEVFLAGTTLDVLRVTKINSKQLTNLNYEDSYVKKIHELLKQDQL